MGGEFLLMPVWKTVQGWFKDKIGSEMWVDSSCWLAWVAA